LQGLGTRTDRPAFASKDIPEAHRARTIYGVLFEPLMYLMVKRVQALSRGARRSSKNREG